ncbi:uncharacterized protein LOC128274348 [Anopheles cruzii]|uniref:uncharacterized protein LOC128274348 n=1 Tax=Anopheles cruzii TaxID=68878 RepID=UPI0022EC91E4|nr:uncharacterized protein LOC128274348 [Anopheles cruzii]
MSSFRRVVRWFRAEPRNVFDVLKYNDALCDFVGLNIYRYRGDRANGVVELSAAKILNFLLMNVLLVVLMIVHANIPERFTSQFSSVIVSYGIRALLVGGVIGISLVNNLNSWNWKSIIKLVQRMHKLDIQFQLMDHRIDHVGHRRQLLAGYSFALIALLAVVVGFNVTTIVFVDSRSESLRMVFGQIYFNLIFFTVVSMFLTLSYLISVRFKHLNDAIELRFDTTNETFGEKDKTLQPSLPFPLPPFLARERIAIVQKFADLHYQLNEIAEHVNRDYADKLLYSIMGSLQFSAFNLFALLKILLNNIPQVRVFTFFNVLGSMMYTIMFMFVISRTRMIARESKQTATLLHKAINNETDEKLVRSMITFSRQVRYRSAAIGSKQIVFDWPFIFNSIAVLASYFVILLQFDAAFG